MSRKVIILNERDFLSAATTIELASRFCLCRQSSEGIVSTSGCYAQPARQSNDEITCRRPARAEPQKRDRHPTIRRAPRQSHEVPIRVKTAGEQVKTAPTFRTTVRERERERIASFHPLLRVIYNEWLLGTTTSQLMRGRGVIWGCNAGAAGYMFARLEVGHGKKKEETEE